MVSAAIPAVSQFTLRYPERRQTQRKGGGTIESGGCYSGVPDLFLATITIIGNTDVYPGLFIEMKAGRNGTTPAQKEMMAELKEQGYAVAVCRSLEEFIETVKNYLG